MTIKNVIIFFSISLALFSCSEDNNIKIGLIGDFTSENSWLGISGRNGLILGINEINESGGINGKQIELLSVSNNGDKETTYSGTKDLISKDIDIIIGPFLSSMGQAVQVASQNEDILVISPTITSSKFNSIDDNLIRMGFLASDQGTSLGEAIKINNNKNIALILDDSNIEYCRDVCLGIYKNSSELDITIKEIGINKDYSIKALTSYLLNENFDGIVFISNGSNTINIIKSYYSQRELPDLYGTTWTKMSNILYEVGDIVDGMIFTDIFENGIPNDQEIKFFREYYRLYTSSPTISSKGCYEIIYLFKDVVENHLPKNYTYTELKSAIIGLELINGISDNYSINKTGDAIREIALYRVEHGEYLLLKSKK